MSYNIAFTGHRALSDTQRKHANLEMQRLLGELIRDHHDLHAIVGMAAGVDQWAAHWCYALSVPYVAAIPHPHYAKQYHLDGDTWDSLLHHAEEVVYVCSEDKLWHWRMNFDRNKWMLDRADLVIAVTHLELAQFADGARPKGGTAHAIRYALDKEIPLRVIALPT